MTASRHDRCDPPAGREMVLHVDTAAGRYGSRLGCWLPSRPDEAMNWLGSRYRCR